MTLMNTDRSERLIASQKDDAPVVGGATMTASCNTCSLKELCLPSGLCAADKVRVAGLVQRPVVVRKNKHIFRQGENFDSFYVVRSGVVKTYSLTEEGEELITGFYLPGEIIGLDGLWGGSYQNSAVALNATSVCTVEFDALTELNQQIPQLQHRMFALMSRELHVEQQMLHVLSRKSAESRLAIFLLNYADRLKRLKFSDKTFQLPMSRGDIGSFLGMAIETVCREFSRMQREGILDVSRKEITIVDREQLRAVAGFTPDDSVYTKVA